ncbi:MAG: PilN domain-containing protein, partial [Pseudomonadota bacterium]
ILSQLKIDKTDIGGILLLLGAVAFAFLPHLFVEQFKERAQQKHDSAKAQLTEEQSSLKQEISKYNGYKTELENFEKQSALLAQRLAAVNELLSSRSGPVNTLDAVGQSLPSSAWLNQIVLSAEPEPSLKLTGLARSSEDITDFSEKLANSIYFQNVELKEVVVSGGTETDGVRTFTLTAVPKVFKPFGKNQRETASKNR